MPCGRFLKLRAPLSNCADHYPAVPTNCELTICITLWTTRLLELLLKELPIRLFGLTRKWPRAAYLARDSGTNWCLTTRRKKNYVCVRSLLLLPLLLVSITCNRLTNQRCATIQVPIRPLQFHCLGLLRLSTASSKALVQYN